VLQEVIRLATLDRIEPAYTVWTPSAAGIGVLDDEDYVGKHRKPGVRRLAIFRLFYTGRHRRD
jgi:hypothetical protein